MIHIQDLKYRYPGNEEYVLTDFNLTLDAPGVYGLLGKNGTGKSTLLYLISGLLTPQKGSVMVDGRLSVKREAELLEEIFIVPEEFELPDTTLEKFLRMQRMAYPRFDEEVLQSCLREFELSGVDQLKKLSMGQKKKVYMSVALAAGTRLLLMDEPTNGLDIPSKALFRKVVASHLGDDRMLIISTHQVHDVEQLIDHVVFLDNHQVQLQASMADLADRYSFTFRQTGEPIADAIYAEPSLQGHAVIAPRQEDEPETTVNLEMLFTAVAEGRITNANIKTEETISDANI